MNREDIRILLVQPGDVLVLSNLGAVDPEEMLRMAADLKEATGAARVWCFEEDIDLTVIRGDGES